MSTRRIEVAGAGVGFDVHELVGVSFADFWDRLADGRYEPLTVAELVARVGPGTTFVDVGAWIGPFTLLAAALGAAVVAVEPDRHAADQLAANLSLDAALAAHVTIHRVALNSRDGVVELDDRAHGAGSGRTRLAPHRRSGGTHTATTIDGRRLADLPGVAGCALLKIDIEGAEFGAVPSLSRFLRRARPPLLLSLHGPDPFRIRPGLARVAARLRHAPARVRLLAALRAYPSISRVIDGRWVVQSRRDLFLLAFRLGETELRCADRVSSCPQSAHHA